MTTSLLGCPHCGKVDWRKAPELAKTLAFIRNHGATVNSDLVRSFRISSQNASNRLRSLEAMGRIVRLRSEATKHGGIQIVYNTAQPFTEDE